MKGGICHISRKASRENSARLAKVEYTVLHLNFILFMSMP